MHARAPALTGKMLVHEYAVLMLYGCMHIMYERYICCEEESMELQLIQEHEAGTYRDVLPVLP